MPVRFKVFRSIMSSWEALFEEAAAFANSLPPDELISISHSEDANEGVVAVWYRVAGEEGAVEKAGSERRTEEKAEPIEPIPCMECGKPIPANAEKCEFCGWTWNSADRE